MVSDSNRLLEIRRHLGAALHQVAEKVPTKALRTSCLELAHRCIQLTEMAAGARPLVSGDTPTPHLQSPVRKILDLAVRKIRAKSLRIFPKGAERRSYPSRRPCPSCGGNMFYLAFRWSRHHIRTCESCGYSDEKVTIITQL